MSIAEAPKPAADPAGPRSPVAVEIVVPVYNEEQALEPSIRRLRAYLDTSFPFQAVVTIADNASSDATWERATALAAELEGVRAVHLAEKGRGRALRAVWSTSAAEVVAYMDVDLSTGLDALLPLVAPLLSGHSDLAIGSRLAPGAKVVRGTKRELISRTYNLIVRTVLHNNFSDAQCGFKAIRSELVKELLPLVEDNEWFFDTELLVLAERNGLRIHEVPVDWVDDPDSRVDIVRTARDDLSGITRLVWSFLRGRGTTLGDLVPERMERPDELVRFARVGIVSTLVYLVLFLAFRDLLGALVANAVVLVLTTTVNTAVHARFTFAGRGPFRNRTQLLGAATVLVTSVGLTTVALVVAGAIAPDSLLAETAAILIGTGVAALARFCLLRAWVFRSRTAPPSSTRHSSHPSHPSHPLDQPFKETPR
ncbi:MAG TPA: bifunctional glycosyltransferase family 2/GtrA family protein [Acidimicrobiales bacterium]|nr:bifunctional glycosyltransferase family 2/GtrA family protein [Acidimicrobiales bacterium]